MQRMFFPNGCQMSDTYMETDAKKFRFDEKNKQKTPQFLCIIENLKIGQNICIC